ncbi:MAG: Hpt domain-containing protein [Clostridia bacterium]|nr:Hpt domain-containing protein [Clostridia bacterium]
MTVRECYEKMGADYDDVMTRLRTDERVAKFLARVIGDPSFAMLDDAVAQKNAEEAFRAAHTIKGICGNLSLSQMGKSASALTESLRGKTEFSEEALALYAQVKADFNMSAECIAQIPSPQV